VIQGTPAELLVPLNAQLPARCVLDARRE